jgi:uncharacterized protein YjbI with pentapeptide repeats
MKAKTGKMEQTYSSDTEYRGTNFKMNPLPKGEFEDCLFQDCDFSECNLSDFVFTDCEFKFCNLSLVKLTKTTFRDVIFRNCKMLGLHFEDCNEFGLSFQFNGCILDHSSFYKTKIIKTILRDTKLQEVDFSECDLTGSAFINCDLLGAVFDHTNLEKVDFLTSFNYIMDPEKNRLKKTRFSSGGLSGLLNKFDIIID